PTSAAGIDARRYPDPFSVDFKRPDKKSIVFGFGAHQCIGAFLARTELRVFLHEWLRRIPHFELKPGETAIAVPGKANGMRYLPLVWDRA
ncbi:MAG TPA: cytochrome P450, partial [Paraburkholderia sp.]|uniref:cytochrome P450 n=1 Tax=Paraburkholderia sp. TaxID=1926495 RepID=UPI002B459313